MYTNLKKPVFLLIFSLLMILLSLPSYALTESSNADDAFVRSMTDLVIKSAQSGNARDQRELGHLYVIGDGVKKDHVLACKWLLLADEKGKVSVFLDELKESLSKEDFAKARKLADEWKKSKK